MRKKHGKKRSKTGNEEEDMLSPEEIYEALKHNQEIEENSSGENDMLRSTKIFCAIDNATAKMD